MLIWKKTYSMFSYSKLFRGCYVTESHSMLVQCPTVTVRVVLDAVEFQVLAGSQGPI